MSRSIKIQLRRKFQNETVSPFPFDFFEDCADIRKNLISWANKFQMKSRSKILLPQGGSDRAKDNWGPLFLIAQQLAEDWPHKVNDAFKTVEVQQQTKDSLSIGLELLSDIGEKLKSWDKSEIPSKILLLKLLNDEELDWSRYDFGRPISFKWLANKLKPYRVFPYKRRNHKAYSVSEINDAIKRYLPHID